MSNNTEEPLTTPHSTSQFVSLLTRITVCFASMLSLIRMNLLEADYELLCFKQRIEPVLKKNRYGCHSAAANSIKGGLRLDTRSMVLRRGESGPEVVPGNLGGRLLQIHMNVDGNRVVIIIVMHLVYGWPVAG
ncbi:MAG: c-type cytochrome domain-containing protein [Pirellulaceae bacterium]